MFRISGNRTAFTWSLIITNKINIVFERKIIKRKEKVGRLKNGNTKNEMKGSNGGKKGKKIKTRERKNNGKWKGKDKM